MFEWIAPAVTGFAGGLVCTTLLVRWANRRRCASTCSGCGARLTYTMREITPDGPVGGPVGGPVCIECAVSGGITNTLREDFN